jgi:hypothetical protein
LQHVDTALLPCRTGCVKKKKRKLSKCHNDNIGMANVQMEKKNLEHKVELMEGLKTKSKDFYIFY